MEGIEGALADPVTLAKDPTMYTPDQERPSSAVVAQLRPLLSVARMRMGAELSENFLDFSQFSKMHNRFRKSEHQAMEGFLEDPDPPNETHAPSTLKSESQPGSPMPRKQSWKVEVPSPAPSPLAALSRGPPPVFAGSKRDMMEQRKSEAFLERRMSTGGSKEYRGPRASASMPAKADLAEHAQRKQDLVGWHGSLQQQAPGGVYGASSRNFRDQIVSFDSSVVHHQERRSSFDPTAAKKAMQAASLQSRSVVVVY